MQRTILALSTSAVLALAAASPALAQSITQPRSEVVTYGELDLNSSEGAETLVRRIENTSEEVCGHRSGPRPISESRTVNNCRSETEEYAVADVNHPNVSAHYYGGYAVIEPEGSYDPYDPYYAPYETKK